MSIKKILPYHFKHDEKVTPKHTADWYVKWLATFIVLIAVIFRASGYHVYDLSLSVVGTLMWAYVGFAWHDRALLVLNSVITVILAIGLVEALK